MVGIGTGELAVEELGIQEAARAPRQRIYPWSCGCTEDVSFALDHQAQSLYLGLVVDLLILYY